MSGIRKCCLRMRDVFAVCAVVILGVAVFVMTRPGNAAELSPADVREIKAAVREVTNAEATNIRTTDRGTVSVFISQRLGGIHLELVRSDDSWEVVSRTHFF